MEKFQKQVKSLLTVARDKGLCTPGPIGTPAAHRTTSTAATPGGEQGLDETRTQLQSQFEEAEGEDAENQVSGRKKL